MKKLSALGVLVVAVALVIAPTAIATKTVHIKSSITLGSSVVGGQVSATNAACKAGRKVVVKYKDARSKVSVYGRATTNNKGKYALTTASAIKGPLPYKFSATVKKSTQGTAGTVYVCDAATSKVKVVTGG